METTAQDPQSATPQQDDENDLGWLTYDEAATALGCSTKTIQRRVKSKELTPYLRYGRGANHWFKAEDITRLLLG